MQVENGPDDGLNDGEERKMMKMMKRGGFIFIREEAEDDANDLITDMCDIIVDFHFPR